MMLFYRRWIVACAAGERVGIGVATGAALAILTHSWANRSHSAVAS